MTATVGVRKLKRSGTSSTWTGHVLAEDHYGTWIGAKAGTRVAWSAAASFETERETQAPIDIVVLIPQAGWWIASWWTNASVSIDVALPARLGQGIWTFEDLELDLFLGPSGECGTVDIDELFEEVECGRVLTGERDTALRTAASLERMLKRREEPFGEVGWERFRVAVASDLPLLAPPN